MPLPSGCTSRLSCFLRPSSLVLGVLGGRAQALSATSAFPKQRQQRTVASWERSEFGPSNSSTLRARGLWFDSSPTRPKPTAYLCLFIIASFSFFCRLVRQVASIREVRWGIDGARRDRYKRNNLHRSCTEPEQKLATSHTKQHTCRVRFATVVFQEYGTASRPCLSEQVSAHFLHENSATKLLNQLLASSWIISRHEATHN